MIFWSIDMFANALAVKPSIYFDFGERKKHLQGQTHSLLGAAEDLGVLLCFLTIAAIREPGLQAVDGLPTATVVADPRPGEETGQVSGPSMATMADVVEILRSGQCRWERNVWCSKNVRFFLCWNKKGEVSGCDD